MHVRHQRKGVKTELDTRVTAAYGEQHIYSQAIQGIQTDTEGTSFYCARSRVRVPAHADNSCRVCCSPYNTHTCAYNTTYIHVYVQYSSER